MLSDDDHRIRKDAVDRARSEGRTLASVAMELNISRASVTQWCKRYGIDTDDFRAGQRTSEIPPSILNALRPHAELRGISSFELACRILRIIVADDMVDAILDDGDE